MSIGLFDSGFGGLTVLRSMIQSFPEQSFVYLGDSARLPYGTKSVGTIRRYLEQNVAFLQQKKVSAIVIACNSASSVLTPEDDFGVPVYGVVLPGAEEALRLTQTQKIGVIGTRATIAGGAYTHAIQQINPQAEVHSQACPLLVPLVEEGLENDPLSNLIVFRYLAPLQQQQIDTLVMGCTHYPVLQRAFAKVLGPSVHLVDSGEAICRRIRQDMSEKVFVSPKDEDASLQIYATDISSSFQKVAEKILAPVPCPLIQPADVIPQ